MANTNTTHRTRTKKDIPNLAEPSVEPTEVIEDISSEPEVPVEKKEYNSDELAIIFDKILFDGSYQETALIRGKLKVVFKSKTAKDTLRISEEMDKFMRTQPTLVSVSQKNSLLNLAVGVVYIRDQDLSMMDPFPNRFDYLCNLPASLISVLVEKLNEFNDKVEASLEEGGDVFSDSPGDKID